MKKVTITLFLALVFFFATPAVSFAGINSLNGLNTTAQIFATSTAPNSPHLLVQSSGTVHTLKWDGTPWRLNQGGTGATTFATGSIPFIASGFFSQSVNLFWDAINNALGIGNTNPQHKVDVSGAIYSRLVTLSSASSLAVDWDSGNVQTVTLGTNATLSFDNGNAGGEYTLILKQDSTGGRTVTWPASVLWPGGNPPILTSAANGIDMTRFVHDGSNYLGSFGLNYATTSSTGIAFDNSGATSAGSGTSCSFNMTIGSEAHNAVLVVVQNRTTVAADPVSSISVGGVSASQVASIDAGGLYGVEMWVAVGVGSGSRTVSVTMANTGGSFDCAAASYSGVSQSSPIESSGGAQTSGTSPLNASTTVSSSGAWLVLGSQEDVTVNAGTGTTKRERISGNSIIFDSNGTVGTGTQQLQLTWSGSGNVGAVVGSLKPF